MTVVAPRPFGRAGAAPDSRRPTLGERLVGALAGRSSAREKPGTSRRGFLGGAALVGAAMAVDPWGFLVRPAHAYDAVCGLDPGCNDGYSAFCCTINNGVNSCPPNSFIGGWWKADNSSFCGGAARYYVDCNAYRDGAWQCRCAEGSCDQRRVACNQFRYGQCSLGVPMSNTGPVVCRLVSCVPPWEQFVGTCTTTSATDNRTASHSAPCVGRNPIGNLEAASVSGQSVRLQGWTFDPDEPGVEIPVALHADGADIGWHPTGIPRPDVNRAYSITGNHGFDITVSQPSGQHVMQVFAINRAGGNDNPVVGSRAVSVGYPPRGNLDVVQAKPNSTIRVAGWAYDPDEPDTEIPIAVYLDGHGVSWFPTGVARPDVNQVFGIRGSHGFDVTFSSPAGGHTVSVYAINVAGGYGNPLFGQAFSQVGTPIGHLDSAVAIGGGQVRMRGWALDPDNPAAAIKVAAYRDSVYGIDWYDTGQPRPDVNSALGVSGNHGFDITVPSPPGDHQFTAYAINIGPYNDNPWIGTTTVRVT